MESDRRNDDADPPDRDLSAGEHPGTHGEHAPGPDSLFEDYDGDLISPTSGIPWSRLVNAATMRALAAFVGGLAVLFSGRSPRTLAVILALVVIVWGVGEVVSSVRPLGRGRRVATAAVLIALGIALGVWPDVSGRVVSRLIASPLVLVGARGIWRGIRTRGDAKPQRWLAIRGLLFVALAIALWVAASVVLNFVLVFFALFWVVTGVATVAGNLGGTDDRVELTHVWSRFFTWLEQRPHTADDRSQLYAKLFFEGGLAKRRLTRFFILMGFATTIAAFGIISDSTAVVIGAMLIAPLMTPLMGTSLSLVMGWPKRATMSAGVALGGILLAIGLAVVFAAAVPFEIDPETNRQIASRVAPTMVDLVIAIAAGGAGAFALSRPDVSDALPGVAVSIALVPPLAVIGFMLEAGRLEDSLGALLLFTTNLVAILLVGAVVFLLTGVVPVRLLIEQKDRVRTSATLIGVLGVLVVVVLGTTGERIRAEAFDRDDVERAVQEWVGNRSLNVFSVDVGVSEIEVIVVGDEGPGSVDDLDARLEADLGRKVDVVVRWVVEERFESGSSDE